jgi:hypothetical protein
MAERFARERMFELARELEPRGERGAYCSGWSLPDVGQAEEPALGGSTEFDFLPSVR